MRNTYLIVAINWLNSHRLLTCRLRSSKGSLHRFPAFLLGRLWHYKISIWYYFMSALYNQQWCKGDEQQARQLDEHKIYILYTYLQLRATNYHVFAQTPPRRWLFICRHFLDGFISTRQTPMLHICTILNLDLILLLKYWAEKVRSWRIKGWFVRITFDYDITGSCYC